MISYNSLAQIQVTTIRKYRQTDQLRSKQAERERASVHNSSRLEHKGANLTCKHTNYRIYKNITAYQKTYLTDKLKSLCKLDYHYWAEY